MERELTRKDLDQLRTAGLKVFMAKHGVPWGREPGRTNNQRRDALWVRLAGEGGVTTTVDAAWWAAARAMASKDPPSKFDELEQVERRRLARAIPAGRSGKQESAGPSRPPGTLGTPGQASGTMGERTPAASSPGRESQLSMDGNAMGTDGDGDAAPINLEKVVEEWQTAGRSRRDSKKLKRVAIQSPIVEKTPPQRQERGATGGTERRAASEVGAAEGAVATHGADQAQRDGGSTESALRRALNVLESARACFEEVLSTDSGGMTAELRARVSASRDAMETLCAGMALQRLRTATAENKRAAQDLARARKELEKERRGTQGPSAGRQERTWAQVAGRSGPDLRAREPIAWAADRCFFLHPTEAAWLKRSFELAAFEDALHSVIAGVKDAEVDGLRPIRTLVRTGRGAVRVEVAPAVATLFEGQAARGAGVTVPGFGDWRIERQRPGAAPSLVAMGIAVSMSDGEVAQRLIVGSRGLVPEQLRGELGALRATRLHSKRRAAARGGAKSGETSTEGDGGGNQGGDGDAIPTRSVRVFLPGPVLEGFLKMGYMKMGGVVVRVRPYTPPQAYCAVCKRLGSHPTESHRHVGAGDSGTRMHPQ